VEKANLIESMFRESKTLSMLDNKNIIRLDHTFILKNDLVLIMEYAGGGELRNYVLKNSGVTEIDARYFMS
jgi:serine/threonine protein kinase